jgi:hypothetical protein
LAFTLSGLQVGYDDLERTHNQVRTSDARKESDQGTVNQFRRIGSGQKKYGCQRASDSERNLEQHLAIVQVVE